ncbi:hypothetical protein DICA3_F08130 [Diutina catenulata]
MLTRGIRAGSMLARRSAVRYVSTTEIDHTNGRVVKLSDPNQPSYGDYPYVAEPELAQNKDPYKTYDDQQNRRNLNDPVNINDDLYDMWSPDYFQPVSDKTALKHNGIFFGLVFGFGAMIAYFQLNPEKPAMPRSFPNNGLAASLGAGKDDAELYQVRADKEADSLPVLDGDKDVQQQTQAYIASNKEFISA